jgi:hypothetical protein
MVGVIGSSGQVSVLALCIQRTNDRRGSRQLISFSLAMGLEQFQEKCETVFRPELRRNKEIEQFGVSVKR